MPKLDAVVLAGGVVTEALAEITDEAYEALIPIGSKPMVEYVVRSLQKSTGIDRIAVVGPPELNKVFTSQDCQVVRGGSSMVENLLLGLDSLKPQGKVLVVTGDIPLLTGEAVDEFLAQTREIQADIHYPVVTKESNEAQYPGVRRTYVQLREGIFTGGNLVLLNPHCAYKCRPLIEMAVNMRKKPWQLARLLGFRFILKFFFKRLGITEIEERVRLILGFEGRAIISQRPEIGIDVDKPSDLQLARKVLAGETITTANVKNERTPGTVDA